MGEHTPPEPTDLPGASAADVAFGMPHSFSFAKASRGLAEAAGGSIVGNCLALRRGQRGRHAVSRPAARGECEGRAWKGLQHWGVA